MSVATRLDLERAIQGDVDAEISKAYGIAIAWPNVSFEIPEDPLVWAQVTIRTGDAEMIEFGALKTFRTQGVLFVNVFGPVGMGSARVMEVADKALSRYRARNVGGVEFQTPSATDGAVENGFWVVKVQCPFWADTIVT